MTLHRKMIGGLDHHELDMASELADSTAARIDEILERAPAGAIHEQMMGDLRYAEGVRDALAWATGMNPAADQLVRLLDLQELRTLPEPNPLLRATRDGSPPVPLA